MKVVLAVLVAAALVGGGYLAAYIPEHRRALDAQLQRERAESRLSDARALLRVHALHDELLDLAEAAPGASRSPQEIQALSSRFFDDVRGLAFSTGDPRSRSVLEEVLRMRDPLTVAIATRDPAVLGHLGTIRKLLHPLLIEGTAASAAPRKARSQPPLPGPAPEAEGQPAAT